MARSIQQIQADLDKLNAAKAGPEKLVQFPDGRRVQHRDMDELLKAIAATEEELRKATAGTGGRVRFAQHKRGDGPTGPTLYDRW
jgi:GTPase involved in cell partitioning and DNA repair